MGSSLSELATAIGLVFVLEGLLLALAPGLAKRLVTEILAYPAQSLRLAGILAMAFGVIVVWLARG
jgi:uncharacterized protein YjeT (DUF2065 family)